MKRKILILLIVAYSIIGFLNTMVAQDLKVFTLEDLMPGGNNYRNMRPQDMYLTWWGNKLMYQEVEEWGEVNVDLLANKLKRGTVDSLKDESLLMKSDTKSVYATLDDVNSFLQKDTIYASSELQKNTSLRKEMDEFQLFRSALDVSFPYEDLPLALLSNKNERILYNWELHKVIWHQTSKDETFSDWCAKSRNVAYIKDDQLCVTDAQGVCKQLTKDGSREIVYGQAVHRNEFGITKGTFWSPDGMLLAFYRMDQSMVSDYPQVHMPSCENENLLLCDHCSDSSLCNVTSSIATCELDKYPVAGTNSHHVTIGVYDLLKDTIVYLKTGEPKDRYFTNIAWTPDSRALLVIELNREQSDATLKMYDILTGECLSILYEEHNDKYVEPLNPVVFLPWDDKKFIYQSQRDGFNHLYLMDLSETKTIKGKTKIGVSFVEHLQTTQLTSGNWLIKELVGFNKRDKSVIITSTEISPLQQNIYSLNIKSAQRTLLDDGQGIHNPILSPDGRFLIDKHDAPQIPHNIDIVNTKTTRRTTVLSASDPWEGYKKPIFSCGTIKAADGETDLYYRMVKPCDFDSTKVYPTIIYVYGGPHLHNVDAGWHYGSRPWETYMAQRGYILFVLDNRGSENRGLIFEQVTHLRLGEEESSDQMKGVEYLSTLPYVDTKRLGIHGWSYGGYMTITLMTHNPGVFKVGVAGGPVIDWHWYEVMYGERYMSTPSLNPLGYASTSLINQAKNLSDRLQIIIGANDDVVLPQHTLQFIDACTNAGTQPDLFIYPGEGHNMKGHNNVHLHERISRYFDDFL